MRRPAIGLSMPVLYRVVTAVLALTGCISLLMTGEMSPLMITGGLALLPGYLRFLKGYPHAPRWAIGSFSLATLVVFVVDSLVITGDVFIAVAHLTITFQAIKSFDLKEPWDHLQVYFMSLLQLIISSELTRSMVFGVIFVIFMVLLVTAMVISHFLKERAVGRIRILNPVLTISVMTLAATVILFMLIPRTPQRFFGKVHTKGIRTVGFSERMDFGSIGTVKLDPTVVMRIAISRDFTAPLYWRGIALDSFDGMSWRDSDRSQFRIGKDGDEFILFSHDPADAVEQTVYVEPMDSNVIFGLSEIAAIRSDSYYLMADENLGLSIPRKAGRRVTYTVRSIIRESESTADTRRYLQYPGGLEGLSGLARDLTKGVEDPLRMALILEQHLKSQYNYSLNVPQTPVGVNPIEDFLFRTKRGFCEHYATSMVMMLRASGIPARIVNGFLGGERNAYGDYVIVRQSDAHSWVEALINGRWKRFDPTPPAPPSAVPTVLVFLLDSLEYGWSRYVIGFSLFDQREIMRGIIDAISLVRAPDISLRRLPLILGILTACAVLGLLIFTIFRKKHFGRPGFVTRHYLAFRKLLAKRGVPIPPSATSGELKLRSEGLGLGRETFEFIELYERYRFGGGQMPEEKKRIYVLLLKKMRKGR